MTGVGNLIGREVGMTGAPTFKLAPTADRPRSFPDVAVSPMIDVTVKQVEAVAEKVRSYQRSEGQVPLRVLIKFSGRDHDVDIVKFIESELDDE